MPELYLITGPSGKQYVGITKGTAAVRLKQHQQESRRGVSCMFLHRAMVKHGEANFAVETLETHENMKELCLREIEEIARRGTLIPAGYNMSAGGESGGHGCVRSEAHKRALGEAARKTHTGRKLSEEHIQKIKAFSSNPEERERQRQLKLGKKNGPHSEAWRMAIKKGHRRRKERLLAESVNNV